MSDLEEKTCPVCYVQYAAPAAMFRLKLERGGNWYCPNGHSIHFTETEADKMRRERDAARQQIARVEDEKRLAVAEAERRATAAERAHRASQKRASAGNCPCCQRTFSNMAEHMKTQHPEFVAAGGANVVPIKRGRGRPRKAA